MMQSIWLFKFTEYSYSQGTKDRGEGMRLLHMTLPCEEFEARDALINLLNKEGIEFEETSIVCLNRKIQNS